MNESLRNYLVLSVVVILTFLVTGASPQFEHIPDPRPQVLSLFTEVPDGFVPVVDIVDGDTILVRIQGKEETVRLLGVDTPEIRDPRRPVQCFGLEASGFTKELLTGTAVRLEADPTQTDRDKYGRLLRYVYLPDGTSLNERLVYSGYAFAYEAFPTQILEKLKDMERDAKQNNRGLWGGCEVSIQENGKQKKTQPIEAAQ